MIEFVYLSLVIVLVVFIIFLCLNKNKKSIRSRAQESIIDSTTFSSGIILFLYLIGKALKISYLTNIDEFSLGLALLIASIFLMSAVTDKYLKGRKKKNG